MTDLTTMNFASGLYGLRVRPSHDIDTEAQLYVLERLRRGLVEDEEAVQSHTERHVVDHRDIEIACAVR